MPPSFDFVVSAENNYYMAWQAMLFHYTCMKHTGQAPIIVVHSDEPHLLPPFQLIQDKSGRVQLAPNYRHGGGLMYPPRNTAGSLQCVESDSDYLVVCDADMLFLQSPPLDQLMLKANQVSFEEVSYLFVVDDNRAMLTDVCQRAGLDIEQIKRNPMSGGVPHVVPRVLQEPLSREWLLCMEYFAPAEANRPPDGQPQLPWLATMWAVLFAVLRLGLEPVLTRYCMTNFQANQPISEANISGAAMLHYCYGDEVFDKRRFTDDEAIHTRVWQIDTAGNSVNALIAAQLHEAGQYFGIPDSLEKNP